MITYVRRNHDLTYFIGGVFKRTRSSTARTANSYGRSGGMVIRGEGRHPAHGVRLAVKDYQRKDSLLFRNDDDDQCLFHA